MHNWRLDFKREAKRNTLLKSRPESGGIWSEAPQTRGVFVSFKVWILDQDASYIVLPKLQQKCIGQWSATPQTRVFCLPKIWNYVSFYEFATLCCRIQDHTKKEEKIVGLYRGLLNSNPGQELTPTTTMIIRKESPTFGMVEAKNLKEMQN